MKLVKTFENGTAANLPLQNGELILIVGRPATGKTALAHTLLKTNLSHENAGLYCCFDKPVFQYFTGNNGKAESVQPYDLPALLKDIKRGKGLDFVVIDYIQALQYFDFDNADESQQRYENTLNALKELATELDIAIIAVSQYRRTQQNPAPDNTLSNLTCVDKLFLFQCDNADNDHRNITVNYYEQ